MARTAKFRKGVTMKRIVLATAALGASAAFAASAQPIDIDRGRQLLCFVEIDP